MQEGSGKKDVDQKELMMNGRTKTKVNCARAQKTDAPEEKDGTGLPGQGQSLRSSGGCIGKKRRNLVCLASTRGREKKKGKPREREGGENRTGDLLREFE